MARSTQVAKKAAEQLPAVNDLDVFSQYAGAGHETATALDVLIPRLTLAQALSPQLNKKKPEYIEGAEIGHIIDVGTGAYFPEGVRFLPVHFRKDWLEWAPRASGQGLVAVHATDAILAQTTPDEKKRPVLPNGNYIAETAQWYGLNLSAGRQKVFLPMSSSQLKRSRRWMTLAKGEKLTNSAGQLYEAPLFYRSYDLGSAEESNAEGDWATWTIARGPALHELSFPGESWQQVLKEAVAFRDALVKGELRGDLREDGEDRQSAGEEAAI